LIAVSALSFEQPIPTSFNGWPLICPPVQPADGFFGFFGFTPAYCARAVIAPPMSCS